ncbi:MAG: AAA family ATPase, partial [Kiritimatiellae bacterium]|nr:AAA family ATPase [Kiritimatiellia bacterium]
DVFNVLLQVLDDGRLTDSHGRTVNFRNTIVILTSNLGSQDLLEGIGADGTISRKARDRVDALLKTHFRPEFLNRLDETVLFKPLVRDEVRSIVRLLLRDLEARVKRQGMTLEVSDAAVDLLVERGYDPAFGARPLKREIQKDVENPLARTLVAGDCREGSKISVDAKDGDFVFVNAS